MAKAKQLVKESGTSGPEGHADRRRQGRCQERIGDYLQSVLRDIGYDASLKAISANIQFTYIQNTNNKVQISVTDWYQDYPAPSDFLNVLFGCDNFHPGSDTSINIAGCCDKKIDARHEEGAGDRGDRPEGCRQALGADRQGDHRRGARRRRCSSRSASTLISTRVGNYTWSDQIHMLFVQAWVK